MLEALAAAATGIALAASAGLRAFLPLFAAGLAARGFHVPLAPGVHWLASDVALVLFGTASVAEIIADKFPAVDHLLDGLQTVLSPLAGAVAAFAMFADWPLPFAAAVAIIVGAPVAGGLHAISALTRVKSSAATAGAGNPFLSMVEDAFAAVTIVLAFLAPLLILLILAWLFLRWRRRSGDRAMAGS